MVGWVCMNKQARIALDAPLKGVLGIGQEAVRFANPLLPDTRSEMALPLRVGNRVVGALDVQSTQGAAFDENDTAVLQGMADQIAIALENARLFQQSQNALQERDLLSGLLVRQGWESYLTQMQGARVAEFGSIAAESAGPDSPFTLRIPLELRGQALGTLVMERSGDDRPWRADEVEAVRAITQQAALALDSARLFEEAQTTAARERLLNEITARIRAATTLEGVLNSAVREISQVTGANYAAIDLELEEAH
jgi:GAF domain-containing protein